MDDPEPRNDGRSRTLDIDRQRFEQAYYTPIRTIIGSRGATSEFERLGRRFCGARIEEADLLVALADDSELIEGKPASGLYPSDEYLGRDQVLVRLGSTWSDTNMSLEPYQRFR
jgi:hypothetical protein